MWVKVWSKENFLKLVRIWLPLKRITKKWALRQPKAKAKKKDDLLSDYSQYSFKQIKLIGH